MADEKRGKHEREFLCAARRLRLHRGNASAGADRCLSSRTPRSGNPGSVHERRAWPWIPALRLAPAG